MSDYISRQDAIKAICDLPNCNNGYSDTYDKAYIIGTLEEVQSADVVEVVRCEDCKHENYFIDAHTDNYGTSVKAKVYCRIWQDWVSANGYCFLADKRKRREE